MLLSPPLASSLVMSLVIRPGTAPSQVLPYFRFEILNTICKDLFSKGDCLHNPGDICEATTLPLHRDEDSQDVSFDWVTRQKVEMDL